MSAGQPDQPPSALVGTAPPSFTLELDATADVTAVNEAQIDDVAAARVNAAVAQGQKLVGTDVSVSHDDGTVVGNTVVYQVQAFSQGYTDPDPQALIAAVKGKSLVDARAVLSAYGSAEIDVWPDFIDHLPDQAARISINVIAPSIVPATGRAIRQPVGLVTRLLGIDLGTKRIGLAVGDTNTGSVVPLTTIRRADVERDAQTIVRIGTEQRIDELVVGLPLNMNGSEGRTSRKHATMGRSPWRRSACCR